jgi:3-phenylpropionate/trans-cinnamate dioxygenase ferredoxin reductase subunit
LVPWFWSDQHNLKLQSVGLSNGHDVTLIRSTSKPDSFVAFYMKGENLIAADCVNAILKFNVEKRLIDEKIPVDAATLGDPETNLRLLMPARRPKRLHEIFRGRRIGTPGLASTC